MRLQDACIAVGRRCRRVGFMAVFLVVTFLMVAGIFQRNPMIDLVRGRFSAWAATSQVVHSIVGNFVLVFGSPFFWQWTGDGLRMGPGWRAGGRAVLLCASFQILTTLLTLGQELELARGFIPEWLVWPFLLISSLGSMLGLLLVGFLIALWEARRADRDEARRQMEDAKWTLLKAQMSPHLLLNSLNSLVQLTRENPVAASRGMRDLGEIYRRLLHIGDSPRVLLGEERQFLERYLAVEQLRFGERLRVEWAWDGPMDRAWVIPLLLQPLVENAIKHGISPHTKGGVVRIQALRAGNWIRFMIANTNPGISASASGTGVGLRNLKARLDLAFGGKARFQLLREDGWTRAELSLPWEG